MSYWSGNNWNTSDALSGPPTPSSIGSFPASSGLASRPAVPSSMADYSEDGGEEPWWELEITTLKQNLKALNVQMFEQKKQWLAEKTALEQQLSARGDMNGGGSLSPTSSVRSFNSTIGSQSMGSNRMFGGGLERAPVLERTADGAPKLSSLQRAPGLGRSGQFHEDPQQLRSQLQQLNAQLASMIQERDAAREELAILKSQAQRWNVERAALQREVDVLRQSASQRKMSETGQDLTTQLAAVEEEKAALQSELSLIQASLKTHVLVPKTQMAQLTSGGGAAAAAAGAAARSSLPTPRTTSGSSLGGADPSVTIAKLNAEITRLQADLYIIKDECVPVPKAEFAQLKAVHSDKASVETELRAVKQELSDLQRLNNLLREEMELIKEEHVAITMQEYDDLRRSAAEKQALELKLEAQAKYYAQVPKEELVAMQAARRQVVALETQIASMSAVNSVAQDDTGRALQMATTEAADLRIKLMETESTCTELRKELSLAEGRAQVITELQDKLRAAETKLASAQQEQNRVHLRIRALEEERDAAKQSMRDAQHESSRLMVELASLRDKCSALAQETATLSRERGELDARLTEARNEREQLTNDLVEAKVELARLREMEVHFKKNVVNTTRKLYGLPSEMTDE